MSTEDHYPPLKPGTDPVLVEGLQKLGFVQRPTEKYRTCVYFHYPPYHNVFVLSPNNRSRLRVWDKYSSNGEHIMAGFAEEILDKLKELGYSRTFQTLL